MPAMNEFELRVNPKFGSFSATPNYYWRSTRPPQPPHRLSTRSWSMVIREGGSGAPSNRINYANEIDMLPLSGIGANGRPVWRPGVKRGPLALFALFFSRFEEGKWEGRGAYFFAARIWALQNVDPFLQNWERDSYLENEREKNMVRGYFMQFACLFSKKILWKGLAMDIKV